MSDDEYYYDDDDDWYWYEEETMGIGDDLAETAICSPIMVEDPSLEVVDTYSDWEYYSDDYYDDDPTIIKQNRRGEPHKKKRKLSALENIPSLSLGSSVVDYPTAMTSSFKGVLWRLPVNKDKKTELYEPGKGEKVSLLSDWRELFNKTPVYGKDWFPHDSSESNRHEAPRGEKQDNNASIMHVPTAELPEYESNANEKYDRYSPPPDAIENMDETIRRQKKKLSQAELKKAPWSSHPLEEAMVVADSEEDELDETSGPVAAEIDFAEVDVADAAADPDVEADIPDEVHVAAEDEGEGQDDSNKDNENPPEKEEQEAEQSIPKNSIRVEIPTLATVMKRDSPTTNNATPPRKRGRKPKNSAAKDKTTKKIKQPISTNKRKKIEEQLDPEEEDENSNKRRSKRVASSSAATTNKKATRIEPDKKKRTRATSPAASTEGRGKRIRI